MTDTLTKDEVFDFLRTYVKLDNIQKDKNKNVLVTYQGDKQFDADDNKRVQEYIARKDVKKILFDKQGNIKSGGGNQKVAIEALFTRLKVKKPFGNVRGGESLIEKELKESKQSKEINEEELRRQQTILQEEEAKKEREAMERAKMSKENKDKKMRGKEKAKEEKEDKRTKKLLAIEEYKKKAKKAEIPYDKDDAIEWFNNEITFEEIVKSYKDDDEDEPVVGRMVDVVDDVEEVDISTAMANTRGGMKRTTQQQPRGRFIGSPSTSQRVGSASTAQPPPVMSPDRLTEEQESNIQSTSVKKAQKEMFDRLLRENPDFLPQSKSSKEQFKQTDVENVKLTRLSDIPNSRASSDFKTVKQLNDDIKYFFSNFGEALKDEEARYKSMSKTSKKLVLDMHKRIVAKLGVKSSDKKNENIGVVIDGKDYVKKMVNEILLTQSASKLRPDDLIINVTDPEQKRDKNLNDIGTYEVKGGRSVQKEPIYQFIPTDNSDVYKESKKPNRITKLALPKTKAETYKKEYKQNEFARPPKNKPVRLKYLY